MGQLRDVVELRKEKLIKKIINYGVYKSNSKHLFELTLYEVEQIYQSLRRNE